jgi:hypothetical protein
MTMRRLLLPTLIATTALAPAAAMAASGDVHLKGSPVLHRVDAKTVEVKFKTDKALPRRADGKILASIKVHGGVSSIGKSGYGSNSYTSFTMLQAKRGSKFMVTLQVDGQPSVTRNVTLR